MGLQKRLPFRAVPRRGKPVHARLGFLDHDHERIAVDRVNRALEGLRRHGELGVPDGWHRGAQTLREAARVRGEPVGRTVDVLAEVYAPAGSDGKVSRPARFPAE